MKVVLSEKELETLRKAHKEEQLKIAFPNVEKDSNRICLESDEETLIQLREACSEYLLKIGFDEVYKANEEGQVLERLIDKLYTG